MPNREQNELTTNERYSPKQTQQIRKAAVQDVLLAQTDLLQKSSTRVDLRDTEEVRRVTQEFMRICCDVGILPTAEGLCARLGMTRQNFYRFIRENPENETATFLNQTRLLWASARAGLAERGLLDSPMAIFLLKNSMLGFADRSEITMDVEQTQDRPAWAVGMSNERYRNEILKTIEYEDGNE